MLVTAQQIFRELEAGSFKPFYLIVGEEPYQSGEIERTIKAFLLKDETAKSFNLDTWDGEHLDVGGLLASLETLPGLFGGDGARLVLCRHFEKVSASALEVLDSYFKNPSDSTCFVMLATKIDKRKAWAKHVDERGYLVEVNNPYEREWPKWHGYFEKKIGKRIDSEAWELLVEGAGRVLAVLWADLQTAALYVGNAPRITQKDVLNLGGAGTGFNVFDFAEDVLTFEPLRAVEKYYHLIRNGESEVKVLSILVRQFKIVEQALVLSGKGVTDSKVLAPQLGVHPFFVPKILQQTKHQSAKTLNTAIQQLAECDYQLKRGEAGVVENFLTSYFARNRKKSRRRA